MASSGQKNWKAGENNALLEQFIAVTGASKDAGKRLLEACNGNLDMAIGMFMDDSGGIDQEPSTSSSGATGSGMPGATGSGMPGATGSGMARAARAGAEAMPGPSVIDDEPEVRAPIPQKKEVLMEESYPTFAVRSQEEAELERLGFRGSRRRPPRSVFDGFRDFEAETRQQTEWTGGPPKTKKRKTLEDLFRPPLDLMHKGTFQTARDLGTKSNRWLIVNIQNVQEFCCQALNRDVWSQAAVKSIIQEHFVFWQVYHDSEEGKRYTQFYKVNEWPYIAILDPRTGENMSIWNKIDALTFCDLVTEFLTLHPSLDGASPPAKKTKLDSIVELSEDSQLEAAIKASLAEGEKPKKLNSFQYISDSDSDLETFSDSESENGEVQVVKKSETPKNSENSKSGKENSANKHDKDDSQKSRSIVEDSGKVDLCGANLDSVGAKSSSVTANNSNSNTDNNAANSSSSSSGKSTKSGKSLSKSSGKHQENNSSASTIEKSESPDSWKQHLGKDSDPLTTLNIRFPDGKREQVKWPCSSKLFALVNFVLTNGFSNERYELVTNFPRKQLSYMDFDDTLKELGLHPQETVFVQER